MQVKEDYCFSNLSCLNVNRTVFLPPPLPSPPPPVQMTNSLFDWQANLYFTAIYIRTISGHTGRRRRRYITDPTVNTSSRGNFKCPKCCKIYKWYRGLHRHLKYECGKAPRFRCPYCVYAGKHRSHVYSHIKSNHKNRPVYAIDIIQQINK